MSKPAVHPHALLRKRYESQKGAWIYMTEVRNATGYGDKSTTYADAVALSLWPSRGIELHGHEIKISRGDWLRELKDPGKAEPIQKYCDRWWLVLGDPDIIKPGELPPTWGLMAVKGGQLRALIEAPKLERQPWTPEFVASFFRSVSENLGRTHVTKAAHQELIARLGNIEEEVEKRVADRLQVALARSSPRLAELEKMVADAEAASGQKLTRWTASDVGHLVRVAEALRSLEHTGLGMLGANLVEAAELVAEADAKVRAALATRPAREVA